MKLVSLAEITETGVSHDPEIRKKVILPSGVVPHLSSFSRSELKPGQRASSHSHADMYEIFFVEAGSGLISINGIETRLHAGLCVLIEPAETHEIFNDTETPLALLYFGII